MANKFSEKIERFIHTHSDHVRRAELPDGTSVIVFSEYGGFEFDEYYGYVYYTMSDPCELFPVSGLHVIKDYIDEFDNDEIFFIVDESEDPLNSVQLLMEKDYWAICSEQDKVKMEKLFDEMFR